MSLCRVLSRGGGGGGEGKRETPPPPKAPSFSPKRRVASKGERGRREEVGNVYYLDAMIIQCHVNSIYYVAPKTHKYLLMVGGGDCA